MRIAWFTPFSKKSAIGKYSQIATNKLNEYCEVDIWISNEEDILETNLNIFHYHINDNELELKLGQYDLVFYNLGDYLPFHKDIYEVSKRIRGIVILHDFIMHNFFYGYYTLHKKDNNLYIQQMESLYGQVGRDIAEGIVQGKRVHVCETDEVMNYPFFEKAVEGALGVITHSYFLAEKVRQKFPDPIKVIYFPFYEENEIREDIEQMNLYNEKKKITLLTFGNINPNKRVDKILEVLGRNNELKEKVEYIIAGSCNNEQYYLKLNTIIKTYSLDNNVKILGYLNDNMLQSCMRKADIFINLRTPAMEGASWSLLEQLDIGKPIVVSDTGFYSEIPNNCLVKIKPGYEEQELYPSLKKLINNKQLRDDIGLEGKMFARNNFTTKNYCDNLIEFAKVVGYRKPIVDLIDRVSDELRLIGVYSEMGVTNRVAKEIHMLIRG